jgi:hypothetical protein
MATLQHLMNFFQEYGKRLSDFGLEDVITYSGEAHAEISR